MHTHTSLHPIGHTRTTWFTHSLSYVPFLAWTSRTLTLTLSHSHTLTSSHLTLFNHSGHGGKAAHRSRRRWPRDLLPSKEHAQERRDVLRTHVVDTLFESDGCSRVNLVAQHVLRAPHRRYPSCPPSQRTCKERIP